MRNICQLVLLTIVNVVWLRAQTITNVQARQEGLVIIITYDLAGQIQPGDGIMAGYSTDGGKSYTIITGATGAVGPNVTPGRSKEIVWYLSGTTPSGEGVRFKVGTPVDFAPPGMVYVAGGSFQMGSTSGDSDEKPVHLVTVRSFYMDKTEVTQAEYKRVMGKNPSYFRGCDDCPVERVSWYEAVEYCNRRSELVDLEPAYRISGNAVTWDRTAKGYRLPTEAEWEYAARGGKKSKGYKYSGGNDLGAVGWYSGNSGIKTHPVGQKQPNELGLSDMSGNVYEWCWDWYGENYYRNSPAENPAGPESGTYRVLRGGSWNSLDNYCRIANRSRINPAGRFSNYGFRCVRGL